MSDEHTAWCIQIFDMLAEGGVWGVPRSGLVFCKRGDGLVLTDRMPHADDMPLTAEELAAYQEADFGLIRHEFALAGITVTKEDA